MASTSALSNSETQRVFDEIHRQFHLSSESLVELTKAFLDEFRVGLQNYNQPMAMMCVATTI